MHRQLGSRRGSGQLNASASISSDFNTVTAPLLILCSQRQLHLHQHVLQHFRAQRRAGVIFVRNCSRFGGVEGRSPKAHVLQPQSRKGKPPNRQPVKPHELPSSPSHGP